ncbi:MAG TPA: inorganic diphosphatase [Alphaproteobacteria bacterium]|jgi:inorganic pyrophosphatase
MRLGAEWIGRNISVTIDRPLGSRHPKWPDMMYEVNYGYIPDTLAADGKPIDVYVLGPKQPLSFYKGKIIAVIRREDDIEDKLVAGDRKWGTDEIKCAVDFQEKYFRTRVEI